MSLNKNMSQSLGAKPTDTETPTSLIETPIPVTPNPTLPNESPSQQEKGKFKSLIWCLTILAILGITTAIVFAVLYFMNPVGSPPNQPNSIPTNDASTDQPNEEIEITDIDVLNALEEKIALLHFTNQLNPTIVIGRSLHQEFDLYKNERLTNSAKLSYVIHFLDDYARDILPDELATLYADFGYSDYTAGSLEKLYDAKLVEDYYEKTFGEEIPLPGSLNNEPYSCPVYMYDKTLNMYFSNSACGGTSPFVSFYKKVKYTKNNNQAFVYINAVVLDSDSGELFCEVVLPEEYETTRNCGVIEPKDDFYIAPHTHEKEIFDEGKYGQYRFVFDKTDDGNYYFNKVEKISS